MVQTGERGSKTSPGIKDKEWVMIRKAGDNRGNELKVLYQAFCTRASLQSPRVTSVCVCLLQDGKVAKREKIRGKSAPD
jgi:hypothetical protein